MFNHMQKVVVIEYWYDRSLRLWTILLMDAEGNQIGNAEYDARISDALVTCSRLKAEHPEARVVKFPAV